MIYSIFDIETDGLLPTVTKIYCLSYEKYDKNILLEKKTLLKEEEIIEFINLQEILIGHNIIRYDIPVLEKIYGSRINIKVKLIDTLAISWYLIHKPKAKHGLEAYGEKFKFPKIKVENSQWKEGDINLMKSRCERDVEINTILFKKQFNYLLNLYGTEEKAIILIKYLKFKMECLRDQESVKLSLNKRECQRHKLDLEFFIGKKVTLLAENMPKEVFKKAPQKMYLKNGELSALGVKWKILLKRLNLKEDSLTIYKRGNPGSSAQLKSWLYKLGWVPITFEASKQTGKNVEKVSLPFGRGLCQSVKSLFEVNPILENLDNLLKAKHRIGIFKSFLKHVDANGNIYANANGLTPSMRYMHSAPLVNLPGVDKFYGKEIRSVITVPNQNYSMIGCDIKGLESTTADYWMYKYDPKYVEEKRKPGYDPHTAFAVFSNKMTKEEEDFIKWYKGKNKL